MATILTTYSRSPWRVTLSLTAVPSTTVTDYTITRTDGGACDITVSLAWLTGQNVVELALSAPLQAGFNFTLAVAGSGSTVIASRSPGIPLQPRRQRLVSTSNPEADAYGVDLGWLGDPGPQGRPVRRVGRAALAHDLAAALLINPTELTHRADEGAGLSRFVNATATRAERANLLGACRKQVARDARVRPGPVVEVIAAPTGTVSVNVTYTPVPATSAETFTINPG